MSMKWLMCAHPDPGTRAELAAVHARQQGKLRPEERYAMPQLDDPRYLAVWVAYRDGRAVGAIVAHATLEVYAIGDSPLLLRAAAAQQGRWRRWLSQAGCDEAHCFVPASLAGKLQRWLARFGFRRSNPAFTPFYTEI